MPITATVAISTIESLRFGLQPTDDGWVIFNANKKRVRTPPASTVLEAVEAAVNHLEQRAQDERTRGIRAVRDKMQQGTHYHRPRQEGEGEDAVTVFDIFRSDGSPTEIVGRPSVVQAWADLITTAPPPVPGR